MPLSKDHVEEMNVLARFNLESHDSGIKVHHDARTEVRDAVERLFHKGLVTELDGGYLTPLGHEAAEHIQASLRILCSEAQIMAQ